MSMEKTILHHKEHRKQYRKRAQRVDKTCRPHGSCPWCEDGEVATRTQKELLKEEEIRDTLAESNRTSPITLNCVS